ncbi:MAG TPA: hypothetical protein VNI84_04715 [Pyrinomonadaceae bacterium]|nr:hypothetical protein [Pyrinomonadaceae bacterium]
MKNRITSRNSERGGASITFLIILILLFLITNAGYNYIPVAYEGQDFKQELQTAVVQTMALPNNADTAGMLKLKLRRIALANQIPPDVFIEVKQVNNLYQARAVYLKQVPILPFGLYDYTYYFDHTATPSGFLAKAAN